MIQCLMSKTVNKNKTHSKSMGLLKYLAVQKLVQQTIIKLINKSITIALNIDPMTAMIPTKNKGLDINRKHEAKDKRSQPALHLFFNVIASTRLKNQLIFSFKLILLIHTWLIPIFFNLIDI